MTDAERKPAGRWAEVVHRRKVRRWLAIAVAVVVVYGLLGFFAAPPLLRSELASKLTEALHRRTTVEKVSVNPFALSVRVRGLTVRERGSETVFVSLGDLYANFKLSSIFRWAPVVQELRLDGFTVHLVHNPDGSYNFSDLIAPAPALPPGETEKPLRYALNNIRLSGGSIDFDDRPVGKVHTVRNLYLAIPFFSNLPDETNVFVQPALRAVVNGRSVALEGRTKPFSSSLDTSLEIDLKDIDIPTYLAYLPSTLPVEVRSALLSTTLSLTFRQERGKPSTLLLSGRAALADVHLQDRQGGELLTLPLLDVQIGEANLLTGRTSLKSVLFQQPSLRVARDAAGRWNLAALGQGSSGGGTAQAEKGGSLALGIGTLEVKDGSLQLSDAAVAPPFAATASSIEIGVRGFDTAPGKTAAVELSFATDAGEKLRETGQLTWAPLGARGTVEAVGVPLRRYQAYAAGAIAFDIADGVLGLSTDFGWDGSGGGWTFSNLGATLRSLRLHRPGEDGDFLTVPETVLEGSALDIPKRTVALGGLTLRGARLAVARRGDGAWNLATLLAAAPAAPEEEAAPAVAATPAAAEEASPAWTIGFGRVALERATVELDDALPSHPVRLKLAPLTVTARGLSTAPGVQGRLQLRCGVGGSGALSLAGDVGLEPLTAKLKTEVKSVPLVPLQGYVEDRLRLLVNDGTASAAGTLTV
ncbi:MAG: DUF748 domain-containing protein, partial [Acidobacteria bacterium]|nr:DUF748 domain-containing protein [Acidobacteriota bacterium]